jgi:uncharacterized protein YndB with AHSA1/START domain
MTPEGYEVGFHGEYLEIVPDERIVCTEIFEGVPAEGNPAVNTMTFTEVNGRTSFSLLAEMGSQAVRDMMLESGMEAGMQAARKLLEEVAISLK